MKKEIDALKMELNSIREKKNNSPLGNIGIKKILEGIVAATIAKDTEATQRLIQQFIFMEGMQLESRSQIMECIISRLIELMMPPHHEYLIWAAKNNGWIFARKKAEIKREKRDWDLEAENPVLPVYGEANLEEIRKTIVSASENLKEKAKMAIEAKRGYVAEATKFDRFAVEKLYSRLDPLALGKMIAYVREVIFYKYF